MTRFVRFRESIAAAAVCACLVAAGGPASAAGGADDGAGTNSLADPTKAASNPLSDAGTSGYFLYRQHCRACHGHLGTGTDDVAPLLGSKYSASHMARRTFHRSFRHSSRDHIRVARGTRKEPGPRFNELELIGKFLREIEAWHVMLERSDTEK